ncbi:glycosyltransferase family 39 protein [Holophaga foetida]|uniref:glycosyltransferase family 39 protein n=1 Tax=Holophaga foetida TaxID=35839 RepID=UPI0002473357|nr:glycosyltransferase family 39 protein [Holophaga foetida]
MNPVSPILLRGKSLSWHLSYILPLLFVAIVALICWRLPNFEFSPDEGGNLMKAALLNHGYPLYAETWSDQPPLFTHLLAFLFRLVGPGVLAARLLVVFFSGLLLWGAFQFLRVTNGIPAAVGGVLLIACLPHYVTLSFSVMIGLPALALAVLSLAAFAHGRRRRRLGFLALSAALLALSAFIKGFTLTLLPVFVVGLLLDREVGSLRQRMTMILVWGAVFAGVALATAWLLMDLSSLRQLLNPHVAARDVPLYQKITLDKALKSARYLLVLAVAGVGMAWSRRHTAAIYPALWAMVTTLILSFHRPVWFHQALLVTLPAAMLAAEIFNAGPWLRARLAGGWSGWRMKKAALALGLVVLVLVGAQIQRTYSSAVHWVKDESQAERLEDMRLTALMAQRAKATRWVVTDRPMYAFRAGLLVPPEMAVLSHKRVSVGLSQGQWMMDCLMRYQPEQVALVCFPWPEVKPFLEATYVPVPGRDGRTLFLKP